MLVTVPAPVVARRATGLVEGETGREPVEANVYAWPKTARTRPNVLRDILRRRGDDAVAWLGRNQRLCPTAQSSP